MPRSRRFPGVAILILVLVLGISLSASAATTEIRALLDLDNDVATGCSVMTVDGPFAGVEMIHTTTVDTTGGLPTVVSITRSSCTDSGTGTFGPPVAITAPYPPPYAVGVGNGTGGSFVVESYLPLTGVPTGGIVHLGFETGSAASGDQDALLTDGGNPMTFALAAAAATASIPTVGEWGLIILGILLVITALIVMRKRPETRALMVIVLMLGGATIAYAAGFVPDGAIGDWTGEPTLGTDATGDAPTADLAAVFAGLEGNILFLRYDMASFANTAPVADDQAVATPQDTPRAITLTGSDADADPLTFAIATTPANGVLTGTAPNVTYTPNAGYVGGDSFTFTVNDGTVDSAPATVTITVNAPGNATPVADDQAVTTPQDTPLAITLTGSDADTDPLTFAIATTPANGVLTGTAPNVTYTPNAGYVGGDSFTFTVNDGTVDSAPATVTITVNAPGNATPVADGQAVMTAEDTPLAITLTGSDADTDPLTFTIATNPANGVLTGTAPNVTYTPNANYNGGDSFTFTVNDGTVDSAPATVTITVTAVNDPPSFTSTAPTTATENVVYTYNVTTADVDTGDTRTITAPTLPGWLTLTDNGNGTATLTGTPLNGDVGANPVVLRTTDLGGLFVDQSFTITVTAVNDAPVIDLDANDDQGTAGNDFAATFTEDGGAVLLADADATVTDVDDGTIDHITVTVTNLIDAGQELLDANVGGTSIVKSYNGGTGVLQLQGPDTLANFQTVVRTVSYLNTSDTPDTTSRLVSFVGNDGSADGPTANATVTVIAANDPPVITTAAAQSAAENQTAVVDVASTDPEGETEGAGLSYSLTGGADQALFSIDVNTGVLTFLVAPDFEAPGDADANNVYVVEVTVSDSGAQSGAQTFDVTVTNVNDPPTITTAAAQNAAENQTAVVDVASTDPEGDVEGAGLTYSLTGGVDQALFSIDANTGVLTFLVAPDFETPGDADANNVYVVEVTVSDSGAQSGAQTFNVTVTNVNDPPMITTAAAQNAAENQTAVVDVQSTDPEGDVEGAGLTYSLTGGVDQALFSIDANTGVLSFLVAPDFETPADADANNVYVVEVTVTDSGASTGIQTFNVTVIDGNDPPTITTGAAQNAAENQTAVVDVQSTDPEGDLEGAGLTYSLTGGADQALFSVDPNTGVLTFLAAPDFETPGDFDANNVYEVQVTVTDSVALTDAVTFNVTVTDANEAPVITSGATANAPENQTGATTIVATDPETDAIIYSITGGADAGLFSVGAGTGILTFNAAPNFEAPADAGADNVYDVQVTATATGGSDLINLQITVTNVNEAPIATADNYAGAGNVAAGNTQFAAGGATPTASASVSSAVSIVTNDSDPDAGDTLTYHVAALPAPTTAATTNGGSVVMNADGSFLYTPPSNPAIASDTFTYTVTDAGGLSDTATVTLTIEDFVWYVDNANTTAPFNGTSTDPFQTLTEAEAASAANQTIYVFQGAGNYTAGIQLKDGQKLFGQGVDLVVTLSGTPVTLVTGNLASKPVVRTTTPSVTVDSTGGAMQNIEIRGLDLGNTATADTVSITEGGNDVSVALSVLDLNTATTAGGSSALALNGGGAGSLVVTEMQNIVVTQGGSAVSGIVATDTVFDADPADADFTGDLVSGGTITIGTSGARLGGTGLSLQNVSGDLSITDLDIFTSGATALDVTGSGLINVGAGTGFQLATGAGSTLDATSGAAMLIDPATLAMTLATVNSSGSGTNAVLLDSVAGTVTISGGSLSDSSSATFAVVGGTVTTNYSGSISQGSNAAAVSVSGGHNTGTVTFDTGTIGATSGTGLQFDNADGTYNFTGTVTLNGGDAGIDVVNGSSGTISISSTGSSITNPTGTAVNVNGSSPAFTYAGSVSQSNGARLMTIESVTGGSATLSGNLSSTGTSTGILVQNNTGGTFTFSGGTKTINTGANAAVTLSSNTGATINFSGGGLDIDTTTGAGFWATGGATAVTVTGAGNSVTTTTGTAVTISNTTIGGAGVTLDSVTTNGALLGIDLIGVGSNPFTVNGGAIVNASDRGVDIEGGSGNVSIGASISTTASGRSVEVRNHSGGTLTFSGAIADNGTGIALMLNAGSTINFTGGLDIDTVGGNRGFFVFNGGTVNVTGANDINTTLGTGTGIELFGMTVGGSGMTFDGVTTDGANGILIDTVSGGAITINGGSIAGATTRGVDINALSSNFSYGGTIANTGGRTVEVTNSGGNPANTITFSGAIDENALGINLDNNDQSSGATVTFSGGLDIASTTNTGFNATNGGTVQATQNNSTILNTVTTTTGTAVNIQNTTIGGSGVTFRSVNVNGLGTSTNSGINLASTGGGNFVVVGSGSTDGSGGTIQDVLEDGVRLNNTDGVVSLSNMILEDIGNMGAAAPGHHGIDGQQVDGGLVLNNVTIQRVSDSAIHGEAPGGGSTTWNGLQVTDSTLAFSNRFHVGGVADGGGADEAMITIEGISGTVLINSNDFDWGPGFVNLFTANSGTVDITVQSNTFNDGRKDLPGVASVGSTGIRVNTTGTITAAIRIGDPAETDSVLGNVFVDTGSDAAIIISGFTSSDNSNVDVVISQNSITVLDHTSPPGLCTTLATCAFDFPNGGIGVESRGSGTFEAIISRNTLVETQNSGGLSTGSLRVDVSGTNTEVIVRNNTITRAWDGPLFIRADDADGNGARGFLLVQNNLYQSGLIGVSGSGDDLDTLGFANSPAPFLPNRFQVRNGALVDLTVLNDDMVSHDTASNPQFDSLDMRINGDAVGGTSSVFNVLIQNTEGPEGFRFRNDDDGGDGTASEFNLSRGSSADAAATDISAAQAQSVLDDNGNTTGGGATSADVPFNGVNIVTTTPILPVVVAP